ncbi:FAD-dependent monooxygenase [Phytomonospora sp. NPDC050363]|uniref:FAD-dependent monooxygenase n=1 Tax=Phytomonospora sp. NPDC050363 TaxID=3155642 RepID=UPI0033C9707A
MRTQVTVAGAGPTGLALAAGLSARGVSVRVVDAAEGPATTSRALGLQPRGAEVLGRLGALGGLAARAVGAKRLTVKEGGRTVFRLDFTRAEAAHRILFVSQTEVEAALRERLTGLGGTVEWGTGVTGAEQDGDGVKVTVATADGTGTFGTDWLVGCDGAHSAVRDLAGIGFPGTRIVENLLLADLRADWTFDREGSTTWLGASGALIVMPLPDGAWRVITEPAHDVAAVTATEIAAAVRADLAARTGADGEPEVLWTSRFRVHRRLADTYRSGRVFLAGDAAHVHSPIGAQGMNTGLADAENLAWKLAAVIGGSASPSLLHTYEAERRPLAEAVLANTSTVTSLLLAPTRARRLLRDLLIRPLLRLPAVQKGLWRLTSQLGQHYRGSVLAAGGGPRRGPRPGDRAPNLTCRRQDGAATVLHAALDGRWAVVAPEGAADYTDAVAGVVGSDDVLTLAHDGREVLLVRPDGHLAWRRDPSDGGPAALAGWLRAALGR